ncbi:hypothetical protein J6590_003878 [Homalodisca vitripennis]|nr:hypothetical protein J6590_003878 [Homalodisca vitripennis]
MAKNVFALQGTMRIDEVAEESRQAGGVRQEVRASRRQWELSRFTKQNVDATHTDYCSTPSVLEKKSHWSSPAGDISCRNHSKLNAALPAAACVRVTGSRRTFTAL